MFIFSTMLMIMVKTLEFPPSVHEYFQFTSGRESQRKKKLISASCWVDKWSIFSTLEKIYMSHSLRFLLY